LGIQLCYTDSQKNAHTREYESGVTEIDLSDQKIASIDLSPLSLLTELRTLDLHQNEIEHLNISPLSSCTKLEKLNLAANQLEIINLSSINSIPNMQYLGLWHNKFQNIDLSPLSGCPFLEKIHLHENQLSNIDLSSLSSGSNLKEIALAENQLVEIDLEPLAVHTKLVKLFLYNNKLERIDLSPLRSCHILELVTLRGNKLSSINLTPFASCISLKHLYLQNNPLKQVDVTPLFSNPKIDYECRTTSWLRRRDRSHQQTLKTYPWSDLFQVASKYRSDRRVQYCILYALDLENFGFIDSDLTEILTSISPDTRRVEARKQLARLLAEKIAEVVDLGGTTTGLMLEELIPRYAEIAKRTNRIIDFRENEMRSVVVGVNGDEMDLRELWTTAYGYNILSALNMTLVSDSIEFRQVLKAVEEIGYSLNRGNIEDSRINMSEQLKESIWWFVENRNWNDIPE